MTFDDYQREAARTGGSDLLPDNKEKGLNCAAMGLAGEAGEVCDLVKKWQHHRAPRSAEKLRKELGDVLWYVAHACNVMGWTMEEVAELNVAKLRARYPDGFNTADSIAKRDEAATLVVGDGHRHDADTGVTHGTAEDARDH
jgi:NTP pyrophosphatase (non-canonical NTP hydrolase)